MKSVLRSVMVISSELASKGKPSSNTTSPLRRASSLGSASPTFN